MATASALVRSPVKTVEEYDPPLTVEEFERMPGGEGKEELHDGRIVRMAPTGGVHGQVVIELGGAVRARVKELGGRSWGFVTTETGYTLWPDRPKESRAPDLAVVRAHRLPGGRIPRRFVRGVPDLAVEVLSPTDKLPEAEAKVAEYLDAGVPLVWLVDPLESVRVWDGATGAETVLRVGPASPPDSGSDALDGGAVVPGFRLPLAELWEAVGPIGDDEDEDDEP
jgi:Uma2 family endonuclease